MKDILEKYEIKGNTKGKHQLLVGTEVLDVDFDKLTLEEADLLHQAGCELFVLKAVKPPKTAAEK